MNRVQKICITVCTLGRPEMLRRCLASLVGQKVPAGYSAVIIVVDNDQSRSAQSVVDDFQDESGVRLHYEMESERGIPFARNRALDTALKMGADWIAFIDDDEVAEAGWVEAYCAAVREYGAEIFMGPVRYEYPPETPSWMMREGKHCSETGACLDQVYTYNTFMRADIAAPDGLGLRFDERLRYTGGSDKAYFSEALRFGRTAAFVKAAIVREEVPRSRVTLKWQYERTMRVNAHNARMRVEQKGAFRAYAGLSLRCIERFAKAAILLTAAALLYPVNREKSGAFFYSAIRKIAQTEGDIRGVLDKLPEPYRRIDGH
ncbi:glycosyltransferase [Alcanivorax sp. JB21]|uniref:glycosyltransferase family 2 protein n=1 Tax=Alcanivorax limicola TaxID=2874102 RepID=UPI001CBD8EB3|nr:glycosyltransferase family 2 protein [Alcanivorax limicola]MBZ2190307.1 glycosyltransferase [Alcanivorax limicola]